MQSANLMEFGTGGGGFIGEDKDCILEFDVVEHSFQKTDKDSGQVVQTYEPGCMLEVKITVKEPDSDDAAESIQYYPVGSLPNSRLQELGYTADPNRNGGPGGYLPSEDNETGAERGPFIVLDGKSDIWAGSPFAQLMSEFLSLGLAEHGDRLAAEGVHALNGVDVKLGRKLLPLSKAKQQDPNAKPKPILVPVEINSWPWESDAKPAAKAKGKPAAAAKSKPASKAAAKKSEAAAASDDNGGADPAEARTIEVIKQVLSNNDGVMEFKALATNVFPLTSKDGPLRVKVTQTANSKAFLEEHNGSEWLWDSDSETLMALPE